MSLKVVPHVIRFDDWWNLVIETLATDRVFCIGHPKNGQKTQGQGSDSYSQGSQRNKKSKAGRVTCCCYPKFGSLLRVIEYRPFGVPFVSDSG